MKTERRPRLAGSAPLEALMAEVLASPEMQAMLASSSRTHRARRRVRRGLLSVGLVLALLALAGLVRFLA